MKRLLATIFFLMAVFCTTSASAWYLEALESTVQPVPSLFTNGMLADTTNFTLQLKRSYVGEPFSSGCISSLGFGTTMDRNPNNLGQIMAPSGAIESVFISAGGAKLGKNVKLVQNLTDGTWRADLALDSPFCFQPDVLETFTISAVASNIDFGSYVGTVFSLPLTGIYANMYNLEKIVWPGWVEGTTHVINNTYQVGAVNLTLTSSSSNGVARIGDTYNQVTLRAIPSIKDGMFESLIIDQVGTAVPTDYSNVKISIGGKVKTPTVLPDGRFWVWDMMGIDVVAGEKLDITISYKVVSGVNRTVVWEIWEPTDFVFFETNPTSPPVLGFQLVPTGGNGFSNSKPWFRSNTVTIKPALPACKLELSDKDGKTFLSWTTSDTSVIYIEGKKKNTLSGNEEVSPKGIMTYHAQVFNAGLSGKCSVATGSVVPLFQGLLLGKNKEK